MEKYQGIVKDQLGTMDTLKTRICDTYKEAHDAAENLCKKTMGDRGTINVETKESKKTYKTYYSVVYRSWGADSASEAWFDDKKTAEEFASHNYRDDPVAHRVSKPETIKEYDEFVAMTAFDFAE